MRYSQSLLRSAILLAVVLAAGCDSDVDSAVAPARAPSGPNALIVPTGYSDVSVSSNFGCAVRAVDGGLVCWGDNDYGKATPPTVGSYRQVSAGGNHACALRSDYYVVCWGQIDWGAASPPSITFSQVSAGMQYSCGVRMDNRLVACWGRNQYGQMNAPAVGFTQVTASAENTCGLTFSDKSVLCWGSNTYAQNTVPSGVYNQVDVGTEYGCGVLSSGTMACWGGNFYGGGVAQPGTYTQVSAAYTHTCAIRVSDRGIVCWGQDRVGMLNAPAGAYTKVSAGSNNACAIRASDLAVVCWGNTSYGMSSPPGISTAHAAPSATFAAATNVAALDTFYLNLYSARVNGYPQATTFTYQFDCGDGKGYGAAQTASYTRCPTRVAGNRVVRGKVIDQDGDTASYSIPMVVKLRPQTVTISSTAPTTTVMSTTTTPKTYTVSAKATSGLPITVLVSSLSNCTVTGTVVKFVGMGTCIIAADQKGDSTWAYARATQTVTVIWPFSGFFAPLYNPPTVNVVPTGRYFQMSFSLAGNRGTASFVVPSVPSYVVPCTANAPSINVTTLGVATPGMVYDVNTARYVLTLKADASWAGTCRTITVTLKDGTTHTLNFRFT